MDPKILRAIRRRCYPYETPHTERFVAHLQRKHRHSLKAIVAYGSRLSDVTATSSSIFDFFVICGDYDRFYRRPLLAFLNRILPPNILGARLPSSNGRTLSCKYNLVSLSRLERETRCRPQEFYLLGRFSKRMGVCWVDEEATIRRLVAVFYRAMERMAQLACADLERVFTLEEFILAVLGLSYRGDERLEAADKVQRLFDSERDYYLEVYGRFLQRFVDQGHVRRHGSRYEFLLDDARKAWLRGRLRQLVSASRLRGRLRWAKYIFTFDDWVDYVLDKFERSVGVRLELTDWERRHPLITAAKYYLRLKREKVLT